MKFEIGKEYHGFILVEKKNLVLNNVEVLQFEHIKSGAKLIYSNTPDATKGFNINFKTYSMNDTGIAHVLEHCIFRGSRKYRTKHPLEEFRKYSPYVEFNGFTFDDYTTYFVSNRNEKHFMKMVDILMDSVFYPLVYENENIFLQEAWRYELEESTSKMKLNGIVYNEMKVFESSPLYIAMVESNKIVFPNTHYAFRCAGHPTAIPELKYSDIINFHKKYYKPENALISITGLLNIIDYLEFLDKAYLYSFNKTNCEYKSPTQVMLSGSRKYAKANYMVTEDEEFSKEIVHSFSFYMPQELTVEERTALNIIFAYLSEAGKGCIKQLLDAEGIVTHTDYSFNSTIQFPVFSFYVIGGTVKDTDIIEKEIYNVFNDIVENGIDKDFIDSERNNIIFEDRTNASNFDYSDFRESDFYNTPWIYGRGTIEEINERDKNNWLRSDISKEYYGELVKKYLLNNNNLAVVNVIPKAINDFVEDNEHNKLEKTIYFFGIDEREDYLKKIKGFQEWQVKPSEDVSKYLNDDDIEIDEEKIDTKIDYEIEKIENDTYVSIKQPKSGIGHLEWKFDISKINPELVPYISLHNLFLWECGSSNYPLSKKKIDYAKFIGNQEYYIYGFKYDENEKDIYLHLKIQMLNENFEQVMKIYSLAVSDIGNILASDVRKYLQGFLKEQRYFGNHTTDEVITSKRVKYYSNPEENCLDLFNTFIFLVTKYKNLDESINEIIQKVLEVNEIIFKNSQFKFCLSCDEDCYEKAKGLVEEFNNSLNSGIVKETKSKEFKFPRNEGFIIPYEGQSVALSVHLWYLTEKYRVPMRLLVNILKNDYIYNEVRLLGGAYVCDIEYMGDVITLLSSRDSDIWRTLEIFEGIPDWLNSITITQDDINRHTEYIKQWKGFSKKTVINTISSEMHNEQNDEESEANSSSDIVDIAHKVTIEDVKNMIKVLHIAFKERVICVAANEEVINKHSELLDNIINLRTV